MSKRVKKPKRLTIGELLGNLVGYTAILLTIGTGSDWFWKNFVQADEESATWAVTILLGGMVFHLGYRVCDYLIRVEKEEVERCATAKKKLESKILKSRRSSKKSGRAK